MTRISLIFVSLAASICLLQGCSALREGSGPERLFHGNAGFGKLMHGVRESPFVMQCPPPVRVAINFYIRQFRLNTPVGNEAMQPAEHGQGTGSVFVAGEGNRPIGLPGIDDWSGNPRHVVSCGGLLPLAFSETPTVLDDVADCTASATTNSFHQSDPGRRYALTRIYDYQGELFPLRVGNELTFSYSALYRSSSARDGCTDARFVRQARFNVIGVNAAFSLHGIPVPGRVYLIERELRNEADGLNTTHDFYYSEELGWVVMEVAYNAGMPDTIREMTGWQPDDSRH